MPATPILDPATGESLVGTEPQLLQQVDSSWWRQRLNLFNGRSLSVSALDGEQAYRGGLLATLGQAVTAGTVSGLALTINTSGADPLLSVSPGYGITANGEDVVLNSTLKTRLSTLAVIDSFAGNELYNFRQSVGDPTNFIYAGILLLQPVIAQVSGQSLDTGTGPIEVSGNLGASCDQDPGEYAFEDWQVADAVRLVYLPWPAGVPALPLPELAPEATLRNRLAYAIFEAEALLGADDQLPWATLGLPVALIAFDPGVQWVADTAFTAGQFITDPNSNLQLVQTAGTSGAAQPAAWNTKYGGTTTDGSVTWINNGLAWKPLFVDCSAVVRAGGLPRSRYVLPAQPPPLLLWQSNMPFQVEDFIIDGNNNVQTVQTAGTSGGPPPQWKTALGQTTTDGAVIWINSGPASWQSNTAFANGQFIYDPSGNLQQVLSPGTSGSTEPDWNAIYLPTTDGTVTWINNGSGNPPIIQPALAQARINQLSEQLSQVMAQQPVTALSNFFETLPPCGILPAAAVNFQNQTAPWLPPNWTVTAAPVRLEELETVLETGMMLDLIAASSAPTPSSESEPVEVLVPLPDAVYDPNILVQEVVDPVFQQQVDQATEARDQTLLKMETVQQELNTLFAAVGPNVPTNPNLMDPDAGLTADELNRRNTSAPYTPLPTETFGTLLQTTWQESAGYTVGQIVIDGNGASQIVLAAGQSGSAPPDWNSNTAGTTVDGLSWVNNGPVMWNAKTSVWQASTTYSLGQSVIDSNGNLQMVQGGGISGSAAPTWATSGITADGEVTWLSLGHSAWTASTGYAVGHGIVDTQGYVQLVQIGGQSGTDQPAWNETPGDTTNEGTLTWLNNGPWTWQPNTPYVTGQLVVIGDNSAAGPTQVFLHQAATGGLSASSPPSWNDVQGQNTNDGIIWQANGSALWQPDFLYVTGQLILDAAGNIQIAQTGGISGDLPPSPWNPAVGQNTQDSGVTWTNLGHSPWQPATLYTTGNAILDPTGIIQLAQIGGTSGTNPPEWKETAGATTLDASVLWVNNGPFTWQPKSYPAGQIILDSNGHLQEATVLDANSNPQAPGTEGAAGTVQPTWNTTPGGATTDGAITWVYLPFLSTDVQLLGAVASQSPYTIPFTDSTAGQTLSLLSAADLTNLETNGLQSLITSLNARISRANDLLDTAFLTAQTDIYRYRQNVLGSTDATALATSPVLANIAAGETAAATSANLQSYINTIIPPLVSTTTSSGAGPATTVDTTTVPPVLKQPVFNPIIGGVGALKPFAATGLSSAVSSSLAAQTVRSRAVSKALSGIQNIGSVYRSPTTTVTAGGIGATIYRGPATTVTAGGIGATIYRGPAVEAGSAISTGIKQQQFLGSVQAGLLPTLTQPGPTQVVATQPTVTATDITNQSPLSGAQVNVRTLTIAERLAQSPSQEAMFYSIGNRLSFLQALEALENDLGLVADDLPVLVDGDPATLPQQPPPPGYVPVVTHYFSEWLNSNSQPTLQNLINSPYLVADSDEASFFSVGVRVLEQHTMLLRALEARVQQYSDFVTLCTNALNNIQGDIQHGRSDLTQLQNDLYQYRQNVAFTTSLLSDETTRVNGVNAQRQQVLQTAVQVIAYTRARTLQAFDTTPSRQLVPANIASPVPACLQQSVAIPPELREIVGQLREAPVNWLPAAMTQMTNLERPILLQQLAISVQARASQLLPMAVLPSSAAGESGAYAPTIASVYSANQQVFRSYQVQRAAIQPAALVNLSWSLQVANLQSVAAVNDLISADSIHTEISLAVARLIQQISSVATCLYTRVSIALPIDRLAWADYLTGARLSVQLQSLAVLPGWNQLAYTDRQQMQMLVDWLFQQIDTTNTAATAFMSDVVRTAILLASDVPIDNITPGNVIARVQPIVGGMVSLNLPSERIASGMYVNLYSGANLAARGVVSDLDSTTVRATVTNVFTPGAYLEISDTAHFTTQTPQALALRPLFMGS